MLSTLAAVPLVAAPAPDAPAWIASDQILGALLFVVVVLIVWVAIQLIAKAKQGKIKEAGGAAGVIGVAVLLIALALGGTIWVISEGLVNLGFSG